HRPSEWNCPRRPNHRGIPATASSAGDPPLERNPASLPPPIQQGNHSIDGVFTQPGSISDLGTGSYDVSFTLESRHGIRQTRPVATLTSDKHRHAKSYGAR